MSKIAGNKALKAYPQVWNEEEDFDVNEDERWAFQDGYDEAVKDVIETAMRVVGEVFEGFGYTFKEKDQEWVRKELEKDYE